jgi:hypothetical protein
MLKAKAQTDDFILKLLNFKTMQTKKMSLANIQGKLSRAEMKNIMAGSGDGSGCNSSCDSKCSNTCNGVATTGNCGLNSASGNCNCIVVC